MKIYIAFFLLLLSPFIVSGAEDWVIESFDSQITIQESGRVQITETIQVNFGDLQRHGIFRDIPYVYQSNSGDKLYTEIVVKNVVLNDSVIPYDVTQNEANVRIKIGDAGQTVTGRQVYLIMYEATGILLPFDTYDEIYWNVTGHEWEVPINKVAARVTLPDGEIIQYSCYEGGLGVTDQCELNQINDLVVEFNSKDHLAIGEGLSVAVGFTKGIVPILTVDPPKTVEDIIGDKLTIWSFVVTLILGNLVLLGYWWRNGRDAWWLRKSLHDKEAEQQLKPLWAYEPIVVEYDPPENLRPGEIGTLIDEKADTIDVSASIVDLAVKGYLVIEEIPKSWILGSKDYLFKRTEKGFDELLEYEKMLLQSLFKEKLEVKMSALKNSFYKDLEKIKKEMYKEVTRKKLFADNPQKIRNKYTGIAVVIIILGVLTAAWGGYFLGGFLLGTGAAIVIVGIAALLYAQAMPRRTAYGREILRQVRGYKVFVSGTEKYRQPFFEKENIFMEVLPYAIVFGVTTKLAKAFKEMGIKPAEPTWYLGAASFNAFAFSRDMQSFSKALSINMASSPSSSGSGGGGFSGGGFGGGGGGSW